MPATIGNVTLYMGGPGAPDDLEATIVNFIASARRHLDVAVQELESRPIARALLRARGRGVRVRVVLEGAYLTVDTPIADPWRPGGVNEANREIHQALLRAKVQLVTDLNPQIFHQKFMVRDPKTSHAAVLTGSTNYTPTGTGQNLNHLVEVCGKRVARLYAEEFEQCWHGTFGQRRDRHQSKPRSYRVSGVRIKTLFAPDHSPELEIVKQMLKAKHSIDFAMFTFAQSSGIDDALIAQLQAGVRVRGVLDRQQANQRWAATHQLEQHGAELYRPPRGAVNKLHHKLAVIDGEVLIVGSFNYTGPANALNDENVMVIGDWDEAEQRGRAGQRVLAGYALAEVERIAGWGAVERGGEGFGRRSA